MMLATITTANLECVEAVPCRPQHGGAATMATAAHFAAKVLGAPDTFGETRH